MLYVNVEFQRGGPTYQYQTTQKVRRGDNVIVDALAGKRTVKVVSVSRKKTFDGITKEIVGVVKVGLFKRALSWLPRRANPAKPVPRRTPPGFFLEYGPDDYDIDFDVWNDLKYHGQD